LYNKKVEIRIDRIIFHSVVFKIA